MKIDLSAEYALYQKELLRHSFALCDVAHDLDLIGADSFKDYLWYLTSKDFLSIRLMTGNEGVPGKDLHYWRVSDLVRITRELPALHGFARQRNKEVSSYLVDWTYWLAKGDSFGVFCEYREMMKLWQTARSPSRHRAGRFFLEVVYGYVYTRLSHGAELKVPSINLNS